MFVDGVKGGEDGFQALGKMHFRPRHTRVAVTNFSISQGSKNGQLIEISGAIYEE